MVRNASSEMVHAVHAADVRLSRERARGAAPAKASSGVAPQGHDLGNRHYRHGCRAHPASSSYVVPGRTSPSTRRGVRGEGGVVRGSAEAVQAHDAADVFDRQVAV